MTQHIPEGSIIITPAEVYAKVTSLTDAVTALIASDKAEEKEREAVRQRLDSIEARVTGLERKVYVAAGFAAAIGASIGSWIPSVLAG